MAVVRSAVTVGHVPKKISSVCSMFLRRGGAIKCHVTASKRHSKDLSQGGLEIHMHPYIRRARESPCKGREACEACHCQQGY